MTQQELFGNARWLCADGEVVSPVFRASFPARSGENAQITICGLGFFELYLNGKRVSDDWFVPLNSHYHAYDACYCAVHFGEEMASRIYAVQYDLSALLQNGENVLTAVVAPGWYAPYGKCKLCFRLAFEDREVVSDNAVRCRAGTLREYSITRGETHDYLAADETDGYMLPGYDASGWAAAVPTAAPQSDFFLQDAPADRVIRSLSPRRIDENDDFFLYDLGENITGIPILRCAEKGARIEVRAAERYDADTHTLPERWAHRQACTFRCDGTDRLYHPHFTWCAGQYYAVSKNAVFLRFDEVHTDVPVTSSFHSSSDMLNWLYDAYMRTQLSNMHAGIPSDCPHLERRGYTGDGQLTCETVMLLIDSRAFYRKWMRDIADCQDRKSGHVQYTAPYLHSGGGPGGWGCAIVEVPYVYYTMYGDAEPLRAYYPQMLRYFDYLESRSEGDLVRRDQPEQWALGEWCVPGQKEIDGLPIPNPFVNTYFYVKSLDRVIEIARVIGKEDDIPRLQAVRARKAQAILDAYYDPETGDFAANGNCANAFALDLGLGDTRTLARLVRHIESMDCVDTGIFGTDLVPRILFRHGYGDAAFRFLTYTAHPSFGFMRSCGANTLWEEWDAPRSMSHPMFGAAVRYLFTELLGIRQAEGSVGFARVVIEPVPVAALPRVRGRIGTVRGTIEVAIDREAGSVEIDVPQGIEAVFRQGDAETALHGGRNTLPLS